MSTEQPRKNNRKKKVVAVVAGLAVVGTAGVAYAYWTTGGTGSGSAATGDIAAVTVIQTSTVTAMHPGDTAQALSGNFNNPNTGPAYITTVTASISGVTKASGVTGTCDASDYTLAGAVMAVGAEVPAGDGKGSWSGATIKFNNKTTTNQDACKNAVVNISYTAA